MPSPAEIRQRRVLVVDDDPFLLELIMTRLAIAEYNVRGARDGREALQRIADFRPEAMVLDINMPVLDGRAALRALRETPGPNQDVPVVAFTADADLEGEGDLDGFDGLVRKPIAPLEMYAAIAAATEWAEDGDADLVDVAG